jgi:hypothetical protein
MRTRPALCFLALLLLSQAGCASREEPLWYKPGRDYTTAEFNRDRDSCTKEKKLDHACMKAKGWVPVSPDLPAPAPASPPRRTPY